MSNACLWLNSPFPAGNLVKLIDKIIILPTQLNVNIFPQQIRCYNTKMIIIIGLGNPGEKFKNTRHNVGFMAIEEFTRKNNFPDFKLKKKFSSLISGGIIGDEKIILVKPQTFMNESGKAVKSLIRNSKFKIQNSIIVVHDDIDLPIGKIKIVTERGSAGHKGVESIIQNIGNDGLIRFRIGIGSENKIEAMKVVLKKFSPKEEKIINQSVQKVAEALNLFLNEGLEKTMNAFNK
jgi:PTH1 family peptidyl-tRNA hydrolase